MYGNPTPADRPDQYIASCGYKMRDTCTHMSVDCAGMCLDPCIKNLYRHVVMFVHAFWWPSMTKTDLTSTSQTESSGPQRRTSAAWSAHHRLQTCSDTWHVLREMRNTCAQVPRNLEPRRIQHLLAGTKQLVCNVTVPRSTVPRS